MTTKPQAMPRTGQIVRLHVMERTLMGRKAHDLDCVVLLSNEQGIVVRDKDRTTHVYRTRQVLSFTTYIPGEGDASAFFTSEAMADHVRQVGRPAMDMINNPAPNASSY